MQKLANPFKKFKGGLAQLITAVFLIIVSVLVFYSAIHPSAGVIKDKGQKAGQNIVTEDASMDSDFYPMHFD